MDSGKDSIDAIDTALRHLDINEPPTVVLIGDKLSGKSSVLESVAGISLFKGQFRTRAPLILKLQNHPNLESPQLSLQFNGKTIPTDEESIADSITTATEEIAGEGKGISNTPLTLTVKKNSVPDLTMVDLPGITRVPVHGQPEDIYDQIVDIIMEYITPEDNIILNVLYAGVDFSSCESIIMSKRVDKSGQRTLAVITKADKYPQDLVEKLTADEEVDFGQGGYVCVRNSVGVEETNVFETDPHLSKIDKSNVGIPVLVEKLMKSHEVVVNAKAQARVQADQAQYKNLVKTSRGSTRTKSKSSSSNVQPPTRPPSTRTRRLPKRLEGYVLTSVKKS